MHGLLGKFQVEEAFLQDNTTEMAETKFGFLASGSPPSYRLSPVEFKFQVAISLSSVELLLSDIIFIESHGRSRKVQFKY